MVMDVYTARMTKTKFVRLCIEVKVDFEYPESIPIDLETRIDIVKAMYK